MEDEFSPEEINQIVKAARVWAPGFTQEQLQQLVNSQPHLASSGFCEAAWGMVRLEQEMGIPCTEAVDAYPQLLQNNSELEQKVADREAKLETVEDNIRQAEDRYQQVKGELDEVKAERERQEKELATFRKKADKEKQAIEKELEQCRQEANVTREEIITAGQLKAEAEKHGFSLELTLGLSQEFAGYDNAREELAKGMEEHGSLTKSNAALIEQNKRLKSDLSYVQSEVDKGQANYNQLERISSELRAEIAGNGEIVDFYHRYLHLRPLIEYLGSWPHVTFHHCNWCGALFWILCPGGFNISAYKCPWCGFLLVEPDRNAYTAAGKPPGTALQLLP